MTLDPQSVLRSDTLGDGERVCVCVRERETERERERERERRRERTTAEPSG